MRGALILITLAAAVVPVSPAAASPSAQAPSSFAVEIDWSMPDRFGLDANRDGRVDLPNTSEYLHNRSPGSCFGPCPEARFSVTLEASMTARGVEVPLPVRQFTWSVTGPGLARPLRQVRVTPRLDLRLPEGEYAVDLRALVPIPWGTLTIHARRDISVSDLLVVAIGDSYAAGEGNPESGRVPSRSPALWADGLGVEDAAHAAAHRSTVSWPARVALALERLDRRTSVSFVSLAETAARIDRGVASPLTAGDSGQVEELRRMVGDRTIDVLLVQVGGNDVGFARIVEALVDADPVFDPICYETMIEQAIDAFHDGNWRRGTGIRFALPFRWSCRETVKSAGLVVPGLDGLGDAFDRLAAALQRLNVDQVFLVGYPDPTGSDRSGEVCEEIVGDTLSPLGFHEVDRHEQRIGVAEVLEPLNAALLAAADDHGWEFVGGVADEFAAGHGSCAPWPDYGYPEEYYELPSFARSRLDFPDGWYRNPGSGSLPLLLGGPDVSWYRTAAQSSALQGPGAAFATSGTLHPNELGHAAIARLVLVALAD